LYFYMAYTSKGNSFVFQLKRHMFSCSERRCLLQTTSKRYSLKQTHVWRVTLYVMLFVLKDLCNFIVCFLFADR